MQYRNSKVQDINSNLRFKINSFGLEIKEKSVYSSGYMYIEA